MKKLLLKFSAWFSPKLSKIHAPFSRKLIVGKDFHDCQNSLKVGQIILSRTDGELANLAIPGFWSHVGMITEDLKVVESVTHGVQVAELYDFFLGKDYVCVLDCLYLNDQEKIDSSKWAIDQKGKPYDFGMALSGLKSFFCSELIWFAHKAVKPNIPFIPRKVFGLETIAPNDFWGASKYYSVIWQSEASKTAM